MAHAGHLSPGLAPDSHMETGSIYAKQKVFSGVERAHDVLERLTFFETRSGTYRFRSCVSGFGFVSGIGLRVTGSRFKVSDIGFRVSGFGFRISGFGSSLPGLAPDSRMETSSIYEKYMFNSCIN